jgi:hypothetical protein
MCLEKGQISQIKVLTITLKWKSWRQRPKMRITKKKQRKLIVTMTRGGLMSGMI